MSARLYWVLLAICLVLASAPSAVAQQGYDFYGDGAPAGLAENVAKYHLEPGYKKLAQGRYQRAMADADFMLRRFPNYPSGLRLAMEAALNWPGHELEAMRYFEQALAAYPEHGETWTIYGVYLHRLGRLEDAVEAYRKATKRSPGSADAYYNLGLALLRLDRTDEALAAARTAYEQGHPLPGLRQALKARGVWPDSPN